MRFNLFNKKDDKPNTAPLPVFDDTMPSIQNANNLITDYADIENMDTTTDQSVLQEIDKFNGACPAFVNDEGHIISIAKKDLSLQEAHALKQLETFVKQTNDSAITRETTRPVYESFINSQKNKSLQEDSKRGSALVNELLIDAINNKATDIHLEIANNRSNLYQRIYGQLRQTQSFDSQQGTNIISSIWNDKSYAKQQYGKHDIAKDGRFTFHHEQKKFLVRVSYGYSKVTQQTTVAIRLRDMNYIPDINKLGYNARQLEILKHTGISKGIILIIGAVNSGKSTTQTSIMQSLARLQKNLEISDQIEVELSNFVQLQLPIEGTDEDIQKNRQRLMRISTRHDVDFIAINEIRDFETATMAASMMLQGTTGIASIHGSGWTDAINRLISQTDLAISADILFSESFLNLLIAQSLIGVLCDSCKLNQHPDAEWNDYYRSHIQTSRSRTHAVSQP